MKFFILTLIRGNMNQRNYYLHIRFSKIFKRKINTVKKLLIKYNSINDSMPAHITIPN